jgi:hypothetical protein
MSSNRARSGPCRASTKRESKRVLVFLVQRLTYLPKRWERKKLRMTQTTRKTEKVTQGGSGMEYPKKWVIRDNFSGADTRGETPLFY